MPSLQRRVLHVNTLIDSAHSLQSDLRSSELSSTGLEAMTTMLRLRAGMLVSEYVAATAADPAAPLITQPTTLTTPTDIVLKLERSELVEIQRIDGGLDAILTIAPEAKGAIDIFFKAVEEHYLARPIANAKFVSPLTEPTESEKAAGASARLHVKVCSSRTHPAHLSEASLRSPGRPSVGRLAHIRTASSTRSSMTPPAS